MDNSATRFARICSPGRSFNLVRSKQGIRTVISQDIQRGRDTIRFAAISVKWRFTPGIRKNQKLEVARENEMREWGVHAEGLSANKYFPP